VEGLKLLGILLLAPKAHNVHRHIVLLQLLGNLDQGLLQGQAGRVQEGVGM
jgi:hypothetical protein